MIKQIISWLLKGAAMGAADAVPGVSGGTIALITGIYERFIAALASVDLELIPLLLKREFKTIWVKIDGLFLLSLGVGILTSLFTVLNLMHWLLATYAPIVWGFFMGVILISVVFLAQNRTWLIKDFLLLLAGTAISLSLILAGKFFISADVADSLPPLMLVFGGAVAISAMILPGISGSFMLLLLGVYPVVVAAVHNRDLPVIAWVALGCLLGVLTFSRFLRWLLHRWHDRVLSFMLGFVIGALVKVWPWQIEEEGLWLMPTAYTQATGQSAWVVAVLGAAVAGVLLVGYLSRKSVKNNQVKPVL